MNQPHGFRWTTIMDGLFEGIEDKSGMRRRADPPANDPSGIDVDDESDVDDQDVVLAPLTL